jgi:hypothetical protein
MRSSRSRFAGKVCPAVFGSEDCFARVRCWCRSPAKPRAAMIEQAQRDDERLSPAKRRRACASFPTSAMDASIICGRFMFEALGTPGVSLKTRSRSLRRYAPRTPVSILRLAPRKAHVLALAACIVATGSWANSARSSAPAIPCTASLSFRRPKEPPSALSRWRAALVDSRHGQQPLRARTRAAGTCFA